MKILYTPHAYSQQRQQEKKRWIYPVLMAMEAEYFRRLPEYEITWGMSPYSDIFNFIRTKPVGVDFLKLPKPDRVWTNAHAERYQRNGNFKYTPATYMQVANGCWHGKCTFCVEQKNEWKVRPVDDVIVEIVECWNMGFKEIFDDSGTFPIGEWLDDFITIKYNFVPKVAFSCNMRMVDVNYDRMKSAGFRMLLFGLESANQITLDKIQKGTKVEDVKYIKEAAKAGLEPHIAVMFGFPWETDSDAIATLKLVHYLLRKGYAKTAQASFYRPENTTKEYKEGQPNHNHQRYINKIYSIGLSPEFWFHKIKDIHNVDDLKYLWKQIKVGLKEWRKY